MKSKPVNRFNHNMPQKLAQKIDSLAKPRVIKILSREALRAGARDLTNGFLPFWPLVSTVGLGGLSGFSFLPWQQFWLFPLLVFLFVKKIFDHGFISRQATKVVLLHAFLFYFCQNLISLSWVGAAPIAFDSGLWWVGWAMAILLPALLAVLYLPIFFLGKKYGEHITQKLLILWVGLSLVDILRQWVLSGLPWNIASHSFLYLSLMTPLVSLVGQYVMSFWVYGLVFLVAIFWYRRNDCALPWWLMGIMLWLTLPPVVGYQLLHADSKVGATTPVEKNIRLLLVQPNLSVSEIHGNSLIGNITLLKKLSQDKLRTKPAGKVEATLIVWPESSIPADISHNNAAARFVTNFMGDNDALLLGTLRTDDVGQVYNSMMLLNNRGEVLATYDKHHLVPFGEYVPFGAVAKKIGFLPVAARNIDLAAGARPRPITLPFGKNQGFSFAPLICFEVAFPPMVRRFVDGAPQKMDAIINITDDAWFGAGIGPIQHLFMAQLRAAENGLPLYRAAMTGVSAVIDSHGRVVEKIGFNTRGVIDRLILPPSKTMPFYAAHRRAMDNGLVAVLSLALLVLCFLKKNIYKIGREK
ncbi:MAG: apolipoprotein N-acyltransferase [Hydrotalea sp.]|nr:apolipoprotein N-acyltransferase [Hydrotalea sp.]